QGDEGGEQCFHGTPPLLRDGPVSAACTRFRPTSGEYRETADGCRKMRKKLASPHSLVPKLRLGTGVGKLCFPSGLGREAELRRRAFPSGAWERGMKSWRAGVS